jgi:ATP-binding protein involved in chromosome partitioning
MVPTSIDRAGDRDIQITWEDGRVNLYHAPELRLLCPCAVCVSETTGERILKPESIPTDIQPLAVEPIGNYAMMIRWSDGHSTGIYSFEYLRQIAP